MADPQAFDVHYTQRTANEAVVSHTVISCVCVQAPSLLPQSSLSTQVSMVQPLALDLLQGYSPDAKLSIFDETLPRADVPPAGVLAKGKTPLPLFPCKPTALSSLLL